MIRRIETDLTLFNTGMIQLRSAVVRGGIEGMQLAMEELRKDSFITPPTAPMKDGALRNAHEIKVIPVSGGVRGELTVEGISYAASLHEGISRWGTPYQKWTTPGSGSHWISSKSLMFGGKYTMKIASGIRRSLRKVMGAFRRFIRR